MTKPIILFLVAVLSLFSTTARADCVGGTEYTGNGIKLCVSTAKLNWFSAFAWCEANGLRLAKWADLCPNTSTTAACSGWGTVLPAGSYQTAEPHPTTAGKHIWIERNSNNGMLYYKKADSQANNAETTYTLSAICVPKANN